ncbi:hypothetical protein GCM10022230_16740 [Pseudoclavibacter caeni]
MAGALVKRDDRRQRTRGTPCGDAVPHEAGEHVVGRSRVIQIDELGADPGGLGVGHGGILPRPRRLPECHKVPGTGLHIRYRPPPAPRR